MFEEEFVPAYRMPAQSPPGWTLAIIASDDHGIPQTVTLCDQVVWARAADLHRVVGGPERLRTGTRVQVNPALTYDRPERQRKEVRSEGLSAGNGWVVLVTDAGARRKGHPYSCAVGKVGQRTVEVLPAAVTDYLHAIRDTNDLRATRERESGLDPFIPVEFAERPPNEEPIGRRRRVSRELVTGDIVWVRCARGSGKVEGISLSRIWRRTGRIRMGDRVPRAFLPCTHPDSLCPSCRIFGSADSTPSSGEERADQRSYRAHLRFGDALFDGTFESEQVELAPLGAPRPGAGQFYLVNQSAAPAKTDQERPAREWGGAADEVTPRPMRGRKYYWHGDPRRPTFAPAPNAPERHVAAATGGGRRRMITTVEIATAGSFEATIHFENLDMAELGGLMAAIHPQLLLERALPFASDAPVRIRPRIGGGKPLGLGSVEIETLTLHAETSAQRYGPAPASSPTIEACLAQFLASDTPEAVRRTWPALASVLHVDHVDPRRLAYPPAMRWGQAADPEFRAGYAFWKASSGQFLRLAPREMILLPEPLDPDQSLPIVEKDR